MLPADLGDRPIATQPSEHDLQLLLDRPGAVLLPLAQRRLLSVERPILRDAPDAISASALRAKAPTATGQPSLSELSTPYQGADHQRAQTLLGVGPQPRTPTEAPGESCCRATARARVAVASAERTTRET